MEHGKINAEVSQSIPKVNLMANLIHWVARAKKEIGNEKGTFMQNVHFRHHYRSKYVIDFAL